MVGNEFMISVPTYLRKPQNYVAMALFCVFPSLVWAEHVTCAFEVPCDASAQICGAAALKVAFEIDPNQFVAATDSKEPPRNKVTTVTAGTKQFLAEPILMDSGVRGFWATTAATDHLLTVQTDGAARYSISTQTTPLSGYCEVT